MQRALAILAALGAGCAPAGKVELELAPGARSVVIVEAGPGSTRVSAFGLDPPLRSRWLADGDATLRVALSYPRTLEELALEPGPDGRLALDAGGWPLPPSGTPQVLARGDASDADLAALLAGIRIARRPCATWAVQRIDLPVLSETSFALPLGDGVLLGLIHVEREGQLQPPMVVYADATGHVERLDAFAWTATTTLPTSPEAFLDRGEVTVLWPRATADGLGLELRTVRPDRSVTAAVVVTSTDTAGRRPNFLIARRDGERRTVLLRHHDGTIARLDDSGQRFETVIAPPSPVDQGPCTEAYGNNLLTLDDLERGEVAFRNGPARRFDLTRSPPLDRTDLLVNGDVYCAVQRAELAGGGELVVARRVRIGLESLFGDIEWRPPGGGAWQPVEVAAEPRAEAIATLDGDVLVGLSGLGLLHLDQDVRRPDVAPRECPLVSVPAGVLHLVPQAGGVFAMGFASRQIVHLKRE